MNKLEIAILVTMMLIWLGLGMVTWIQDDGHKKLVAKFVRFVESRRRKRRKRRKIHKSKRRTGV